MPASPPENAAPTARRRFGRDARGAAAVEFALIVPVLIGLYFGLVAITIMTNVNRKMTLLSRSLADLTARSQTGVIDQTEMGNIFSASSAIMYPYDATTLQMVVSSIRVTKVNNVPRGTVLWSCGRNLTAKPNNAPPSWSGANLERRQASSTYAVPAGFEDSASFILVETRMLYRPIVAANLLGTRVLDENTPWPVRNVAEVSYSGSCPSG